MTSQIRFTSYPLTEGPPDFVARVVDVFRKHEGSICTEVLTKGLESDAVLALLSKDLQRIGFATETGKSKPKKIDRPVFFGENGVPTLRYQIDGYHSGWRCGIEIEAGRAWMGNAVYRDLVQASVMVDVDHLCLAVPLSYKYKSNGRLAASHDYANTTSVADALYGHSRVKLPYGLTVIGY